MVLTGLENRKRILSLDAEGISTIDDLAEWEEDDWIGINGRGIVNALTRLKIPPIQDS